MRIGLLLLLAAILTVSCTKATTPTPEPQPGAGSETTPPGQGTQQPDATLPPGSSQPTEPQEPTTPQLPSTPADPLEATLEQMTPDQKIGQLILAGVAGTAMDEQTKQLITAYGIGGFILYKSNIDSIEQTVALLNALKEANSPHNIPLLLSVDQEGGSVSRLPADFAAIPSSRIIGKYGDPKRAENVGEVIGMQLRALGFNVNYAPVLDVDSNPNNPVIGSRSFGTTAAIASEFGIAEMRGLRRQGVIPVVKHFPGHGDTAVDSHLDLPVVTKSREQLAQLELIPFQEAIRAGAESVMVAHILLPKLDPDWPSSLSPAIIDGLLRQELGFDGVVMTDDMTMGAIAKNYDFRQAVVRSVAAGSDIVLVAHGYEQAVDAVSALKQAVQDGTLSMERIDQSVRRILALKQSYHVSDEAVRDKVDVEGINDALKQALEQ